MEWLQFLRNSEFCKQAPKKARKALPGTPRGVSRGVPERPQEAEISLEDSPWAPPAASNEFFFAPGRPQERSGSLPGGQNKDSDFGVMLNGPPGGLRSRFWLDLGAIWGRFRSPRGSISERILDAFRSMLRAFSQRLSSELSLLLLLGSLNFLDSFVLRRACFGKACEQM